LLLLAPSILEFHGLPIFYSSYIFLNTLSNYSAKNKTFKKKKRVKDGACHDFPAEKMLPESAV